MTLRDIKTVALCLPGIIEHGSGRVRLSRIFSEANISLTAAIKGRLGIDTIIESDANAIAMAAYWFGSARNCDDFVLVTLEERIDLSVMHEGQLFRGAQQLSLTLGDMAMGTDPLQNMRLSDLASERAILQAAEYDSEVQEGVLFGQAIPRIREMLESGDTQIAGPVDRAGAALGIAIANLVGLFAPPVVLLAGSCTALGDYLLEPLRRAFAEVIPPSLENVAEISVAEAPDELWARGAAAVALSELYGAPWSTTGPARQSSQLSAEGG
jgi:predicted NBD/HSP70 family sugar kinase